MSEIDATRVSHLLQIIASTEDEEIDCDDLSRAIDSAAEAAARGADIRGTLPKIAVHLDHCPDCREWYDMLVELVREEDKPQDGGV
jgi:predicted anti-sigma-YlaC factor YlaD